MGRTLQERIDRCLDTADDMLAKAAHYARLIEDVDVREAKLKEIAEIRAAFKTQNFARALLDAR